MAEVDEETDGWVENISVAYCNSCFLGYNKLMPLDRLEGDHEEEDDKVAVRQLNPTTLIRRIN